MKTNTAPTAAPLVLVVEDEPGIATILSAYLERDGLRSQIASDGLQALQMFRQITPDLVLLDIHLPTMDGIDVLRAIRDQGQTPVIMVTALADDVDKLVALRLGADDYVLKPVRPRVLLARIRALLRRREGVAEAPEDRQRLQFGPLVIDSAMREAWLGEQGIELTSAEFDLLWLLTSNAGRILSREEIFNALRGIEYDGQDRSIDVRISRIRPKIGDDPMHPRLIKTVRSKGYLFVAEAAEAMA